MEILFENPIILIILFGIISSLFRNKNKDEKQKSPQTRTAKNGNRTFDELKDVFQEFNRTFQEETKPIDNREKRNEVKESIPSSYMEKVENLVETSSIPIQEEKSYLLQAAKPEPQRQLKVDESKIVDAVIWSEILGPPRAKNPRVNKRLYRKY